MFVVTLSTVESQPDNVGSKGEQVVRDFLLAKAGIDWSELKFSHPDSLFGNPRVNSQPRVELDVPVSSPMSGAVFAALGFLRRKSILHLKCIQPKGAGWDEPALEQLLHILFYFLTPLERILQGLSFECFGKIYKRWGFKSLQLILDGFPLDFAQSDVQRHNLLFVVMALLGHTPTIVESAENLETHSVKDLDVWSDDTISSARRERLMHLVQKCTTLDKEWSLFITPEMQNRAVQRVLSLGRQSELKYVITRPQDTNNKFWMTGNSNLTFAPTESLACFREFVKGCGMGVGSTNELESPLLECFKTVCFASTSSNVLAQHVCSDAEITMG